MLAWDVGCGAFRWDGVYSTQLRIVGGSVDREELRRKLRDYALKAFGRW
jgi:hypothetical protein